MMKNLTKIFMTVVAGMFAFSCVTDTTDDLGVELGNESTGKGETIISLSMAEARTHISEAVGNKYPMYWSENDKISVNGVTSTNIVLSEDKTVATFTIPSNDLGDTWNIAYPAVDKDGYVKFAKNQTHTAGTFGNDVTTMYASCPANESVVLKPLIGILKIGFTGSGEKLVKAQISTVDHKPIAGTFAFDFAKGEILSTTPVDVPATDDAEAITKYTDANESNVISYSFGDAGLILGTTAQYIHVAVPAGEYKELYVTLYDDNGGVMRATVKAPADNPETEKVENLAPGQFRSFGSTLYAANNDVFVISSTEDLYTFATEVGKGSFTKDVYLVEDIDMTDKEWTPLKWDSSHTVNEVASAATFYGNGYSITGMTQPLFHTLQANVVGLHFKKVNITTNTTVMADAPSGSLARYSTAAGTCKILVSDCSAEGTITVNNPEYQSSAITQDGNKDHSYGGIIGRAYGTDIDSCVGKVNITVTQLAVKGTTKRMTANIGGITGYAAKTGNYCANIYNCVSYATLSYEDTAIPTTSMGAYIGGICGRSYITNREGEFKNNTNYGELKFNSTINDTADKDVAGLYMGGVIGYIGDPSSEMVVSDNSNKGAINVNGGAVNGEIYIGGVIGHGVRYTMSSDKNYGPININGGTFSNKSYIGGVIGYGKDASSLTAGENHGAITTKADATITNLYVGGIGGSFVQNNCHTYQALNKATITINSTAPEEGGATRIGGIAGSSQGRLRGCTNDTSGRIILSGTFCTTGSRFDATEPQTFGTDTFFAGGVCGYKTTSPIESSSNLALIEFSGTETSVGETLTQMRIGGIVGFTSQPTPSATSSGKITISGTINSELHLGGIMGFTYNPEISGITNDADIEISGTLNAGVALGGVIGYVTDYYNVSGDTITSKGAQIESLTNNGDISITSDATIIYSSALEFYAGGCIGYVNGTVTADAEQMPHCKTLTNNGKLDINGTLNARLLAAGVVGYIVKAPNHTTHLEDITNSATGTITYGATYSRNQNVSLTGAVGRTEGTVSDVENNGEVNVGGSFKKNNIGIAGAVGFCAGGDQITNNASVNVSANLNGASQTRLAGALVYSSNGALSNATNNGAVSYTGTADNDLFFSGVAHSSNISTTSSKNTGAMSFAGTCLKLCVSGCLSVVSGTVSDCDNEADITVSGTINDYAYIGGISCKTKSTVEYKDCDNSGSITIDNATTMQSYVRVAGVIGELEAGAACTFNNCSNSGSITVGGKVCTTDKTNLRIGGCVANYEYGTITILNKLENSGSITCTADASTSSHATLVGGVFGYTKLSLTTSEEAPALLYNSGALSYSGKTQGDMRIGGVIGHNVPALSLNIKNEGDITVEESAEIGSGKAFYIGGAVGKIDSTLSNARAYCTITAYGRSNVGMITGSARTETVKATNCYVGGAIDKGDGYGAANNIPLSKDNYFGFIYGTLPAGNMTDLINVVVGEDKCGYLGTSVNDNPEFASVPSGDTAE